MAEDARIGVVPRERASEDMLAPSGILREGEAGREERDQETCTQPSVVSRLAAEIEAELAHRTHSTQTNALRAWRSLHHALSSENSAGMELHSRGTKRQREVENALNAVAIRERYT